MNSLWTTLSLISLGNSLKVCRFDIQPRQLPYLGDHSCAIHFLPHFQWGFHTHCVYFFSPHLWIYLLFRAFARIHGSSFCSKLIFASDRKAVSTLVFEEQECSFPTTTLVQAITRSLVPVNLFFVGQSATRILLHCQVN